MFLPVYVLLGFNFADFFLTIKELISLNLEFEHVCYSLFSSSCAGFFSNFNFTFGVYRSRCSARFSIFSGCKLTLMIKFILLFPFLYKQFQWPLFCVSSFLFPVASFCFSFAPFLHRGWIRDCKNEAQVINSLISLWCLKVYIFVTSKP